MNRILSSLPLKKLLTSKLQAECLALKEKNIFPYLKVVLVGANPASIVYTSNKKKFCEKVGALCDIVSLDESISAEHFLRVIREINEDPRVHGCIIQLPLPKHLEHLDDGYLVAKEKDVDGFHPENLYAVLKNSPGNEHFVSCTPKGVMTLMRENNIQVEGKHAVVIGRSMIVGKPMAMLLTNANATVTLCHSQTKNLKDITRNCDIIVSAVGRARFLDESYLSPNKNQVLIDVGINTDGQGHLCGDVDFEKVVDHVSFVTPVPGGVGPMTIVSLIQNLLQASKNKLSV